MSKKIELGINILFKIFLFSLFLFARTFTGVNILGIRLGEILIGSGLLILFYFLFLKPAIKNKYIFEDNKFHLILFFVFFIFVVSTFLNSNSFFNPLVYKSSSYIWSIGYLFFGIYLNKIFSFEIQIYDIFLSIFGMFVIYLFSTRGISENLQNSILSFTDKFEYPKGSDLLLVFVFVMVFVLNKLKYSKLSFNLVFFVFSFYAPLLMVKSRSAFIASVLFMILLIPYFRKNFKILDFKIIYTILISIIIFVLSTSWVVSRDLVVDDEISDELKFAITNRYRTINDNVYEEEYLKLNLFYFKDGRLFTTDGNLNWRFQIWQDIFLDMLNLDLFLFGYGYEDLIPAMDNDQRLGQDQTNVNVHNYFVHIFSRGGILSLTFICLFYFYLYKKFKHKNLQLDYLQIFIPLIFNSMFDPCMENAHYPIVFYLLLGLTFNKYIIFKEENI